MTLLVVLLLLSYLTGSIPTSIIIGKTFYSMDIREHGSGNAGGTNTFRVLGWKPALAVTLVDIFKGWVAAAWFSRLAFGGALGSLPFDDPVLMAILCGLAAVLGHSFTLFAGFRGGKGVGTLAGMVIYLFPLAVLICLGVWILVLIFTGYVGLSSVLAVTFFPIVTFFRDGTLISTLGIFSLLIPLFIWYTHRSNMQRLFQGTENRFEKAMVLRRRTRDA